MILRFIATMAMILSLISTISSCDGCGVGLNAAGVGLLQNFRTNFIQLTSDLSHFDVPTSEAADIHDEIWQTALAARFAVGKSKRLKVNARLPYVRSVRHQNELVFITSGLGDIQLSANYALLPSILLGSGYSVYLEAGLGLQLPTGINDPKIYDRNLPQYLNAGRGNVGFALQSNAVVAFGEAGLSVSARHQINRHPSRGYSFGAESSLQVGAFRSISLNDIQLTGAILAAYLHNSVDRYANQKEVPDSGSEALLLRSTIGLRYDDISIIYGLAQPIFNAADADKLNIRVQHSVAVNYLF